ncbi:MAG: DUF1614 domain-containing protein [Thermoplasmatales archaeon]|nr:DUF1614 domain-containing protein [Thermoplasmatales archaeon]
MISLFIFLILALISFLVYSILTYVFEEVGFKWWEASLIVFGSVLFRNIDIPLFQYKGMIIAINLSGAFLPLMISIYLIISRKIFLRSLPGIAIVSFIAYMVSYPSSQGIVSPFPYWLLPPVSAGLYSLIAGYKNKRRVASIAYSCGTFGAIIGADFLHFEEFLEVASPGIASIGGAAILDMVFLTGIIAVIIAGLLYE